MSHEDPRRPDVNEPLPKSLAHIADLLGQVELPPSTVSGDELLYRAGWDAAKRELLGSAHLSPRQGSRFATLGWSAASALIAMSVTVVLMWPHPPIDRRGNPVVEGQRVSPEATADAAPPVEDVRSELASQEPSPRKPASPVIIRPRKYAQSAPLLIQREHALQQWNDPAWMHRDANMSPSTRSAQSALPNETPLTAREMLKEFLPDHEPNFIRSRT